MRRLFPVAWHTKPLNVAVRVGAAGPERDVVIHLKRHVLGAAAGTRGALAEAAPESLCGAVSDRSSLPSGAMAGAPSPFVGAIGHAAGLLVGEGVGWAARAGGRHAAVKAGLRRKCHRLAASQR